MYYLLQTVRFLAAVVLASTASAMLEVFGIVRFGPAENTLLVALVCWLLGFPLRRFSRHYGDWAPKASGRIHAGVGIGLAVALIYAETMSDSHVAEGACDVRESDICGPDGYVRDKGIDLCAVRPEYC